MFCIAGSCFDGVFPQIGKHLKALDLKCEYIIFLIYMSKLFSELLSNFLSKQNYVQAVLNFTNRNYLLLTWCHLPSVKCAACPALDSNISQENPLKLNV